MKRGGIAATFCDLDETLYPGLSIKDASSWFLQKGYLSRWNYLKIAWWIMLKKLGRLDDEAAFAAGVGLLAGWQEIRFKKAIGEAYAAVLRPKLRPAIYKQMVTWKKRGPVVLVTETLAPIAETFARDLGADAVIATQLDVQNGRLTGKLVGPVMRGEAKLSALRAFAEREKIDLRASIGVGGQIEDTPLIVSCGQGIVINPNNALACVARQAGWKILRV
ncbi:MAG: HAD-IB family hydrolase [Patescibacteria group bacterium]